MKSDRLVIFAVLFLAAGVGLLIGFTNGTSGLNVAYPLSETRLHVDITTTGIPVLVGVPLVAAGALLLFFALIAAIASQFRRPEPIITLDLPKRREPFGEFGEARSHAFGQFEE
jgi:hypothetical protein